MKLSEMQKAIYQNKIDHQFNVTNIEKEFLALYGEVGEAFDAYRKQQEVGEELADVAIYLLGLAEILSIDLEAEIHKKMASTKSVVIRVMAMAMPNESIIDTRTKTSRFLEYRPLPKLKWKQEIGWKRM